MSILNNQPNLGTSVSTTPVDFSQDELLSFLSDAEVYDETSEAGTEVTEPTRTRPEVSIDPENPDPMAPHDRIPIGRVRIGDVVIPFRVTAATGLWNKETESVDVEPVLPAHVNNMLLFHDAFERGNETLEEMYKRASTILTTSAVAIAMEVQPRVRVSVAEGRVVMSNRVPYGTWYPLPGGEGIALNERECAEFKIDSDGDLVAFAIDPYGATLYPRIKNPITKKLANLSKLTKAEWDATEEQFENLDKKTLALFARLAVENCQADTASTEAIFRKTHNVPNIGILDSALKITELEETRNLPYWERISRFYQSDRAFKVLEEDALGAARKTGADIKDFSEIELDLTRTMRGDVAPFITRTGSISASPAGLSWLHQSHWKEELDRIRELDLPRPIKKVIPRAIWEDIETRRDGNVIHRMINLGLMKAHAFQHRYLPLPCYVVTLHEANGNVVGLTNVKDAGVVEGLGFHFILMPVFDKETGVWWDAIDHMSYMSGQPWTVPYVNKDGKLVPSHPLVTGDVVLDGVDTAILGGGEFVRYLFDARNREKSLEDATNPKRSYKIGRLLDWISAYAGRYGLVVPSHHANPLIPSQEGILTASEIGVVCFGYWKQRKAAIIWKREAAKRAAKKNRLPEPEFAPLTEDWDYMFRIWKQANAALEGVTQARLIPSSKGGNDVRKYFFSPDASYWKAGSKACNPRRQGQMLSQLSRGRILEEFEVAIIIGETEHQTFVTPSGVDKMQVGSCFSGKTSLSKPLPEETDKKLIKFGSFRGQLRAAYIGHGKRTAKIGKLVDLYGTKTVPMPERQFSYKDKLGKRVKIDLLYPVQEAADKGIISLLRGGELKTITDGTRSFTAYVLRHKFFRTTTPTENMLNRRRRKDVHGFDAHMLIDALNRAGHMDFNGVFPKVELGDMRFAQQLRRSVREFLDQYGFDAEAIASDTMDALHESWSYRAISDEAESDSPAMDKATLLATLSDDAKRRLMGQ